MILIICTSCCHGLCISSGDQRGNISEAMALFGPGSDWYPDQYPCHNCQGRAEFVAAADPAALREVTLADLSPVEAFAAMSGLGLPEEQECSPSALEKVLLASPVRSVQAVSIRGSHRSILNSIELEDGTKIYLGSSAYGATVYRIAKPHSYAEAADHG